MDNLARFKKVRWHYIHERYRTPFYTYIIWDPCTKPYNKRIPFAYNKIQFIYLDRQIAIAEPGWQAMHRILTRRLAQDPSLLKQLLLDSYKINGKMEQWCRTLDKQNFSRVTDQIFLELWERYIELLNQFGGYVLLPLFVEPDMEQQLRGAIVKIFGPAQSEHIFQVLTTPLKYGATQQEEQSLLRLAIKSRKSILTARDITKYIAEFSWIKNNSFDGSYFTAPELQRRINILAKKDPEQNLKNILQQQRALRAEFGRYLKKLGKDKKIKVLIETLQESIYFRSWRTERYYRNAYFLQNFFQHTAQLLGLAKTSDLFFLTPPEIISGLRNGSRISKALLKERRKGYMFLAEPEKNTILSGTPLAKAKKQISVREIKSTTEISGMCAYPGRVSGKVFVLKSKKDLGKIQPNTILVTPSTTVDYVPHLRKVSAIITNEGGVLSHASVISRELRIPCVIGTKIATEVLKTGDRVEVDAINGKVTIL
jgi:phosphoenolpyruvate synthase/pyruvate phosphate dikinase